MNTIIFFLIFYFCFTALIGLGLTSFKNYYKWHDKLIAVLFGWLLVPISIGVIMSDRK